MGMLVYALVDEVAERYLSLVDTLEDEIDELEERLSE
jgi:Mg2+ and Co2+ transporter CorA